MVIGTLMPEGDEEQYLDSVRERERERERETDRESASESESERADRS
jgi:hypothetical protein